MKSKFFSAVAILVGTIIGAGIFGIPYAVSKVGFIPGVFYLIGLCLVTLIVTLAYGEVVSRTKDYHQMTGYARKYLGRWGKGVITFSLIFGIYGALLAYMIGVGDFLNALLSPYFGGSSVLYSSLFFIFASLAILAGLGTVVQIERFMVFFLFLVVGLIFAFGIGKVNLSHLSGFNPSYLFLPYGVILFAYTGVSAVPDMKKILYGQEGKFKKTIFIGLLIAFIVYLLFAFIVVGVSGSNTSEEAIIGLENIIGKKIFIIGAIFGILTMTTSFLTLGLVLKEIFIFDYKINKAISWIFACFVPYLIFLSGLIDFIKAIDIVGTITGGLNGIVILLMFKRAKKKGEVKPSYCIKIPQPLIYFLFLIFGLGIIYQIFYIFF